MDDTSKHAKFQVDGFSTFGDMTSEKFNFQNGTSHRDSIFTSWIQAKLDKNHFLCLKTPVLAQSYFVSYVGGGGAFWPRSRKQGYS